MSQLMLRAGFCLSVGILAVLSLSLVPVSSRAQTSGGSGLPGLTDTLVDAPAATGPFAYNSFVPYLTTGTSYVDPVFGATVRRVSSDQAADSTYARNMWWSADGTRYLHNSRIIEVATGRVTHTGLPMGNSANGNTNMGFDPVDPNVLYYYLDNTLRKITLQSGEPGPIPCTGPSPGHSAIWAAR